MTGLHCPISESRMKPQDAAPLLTLFVPTYNRTPEMVQTIESLAGQLHGGLERKVEIIVSDNASDAAGQEAVRSLADRFETVSYVFNTTDQGGHFQVYAAPWRARGTWTWVFGSDDLLVPGAVGDVVSRLEAEDPSFLTMDKSIWNRDLSQELYASANGIPDRVFPAFIDLFKGVGLHQVAYLSASLEKTSAGRSIDPHKYLSADTYHNYTIAYFEKHRDKKCVYVASPHIQRRLDNMIISDYLGVTFEDVGMKFPVIMLNLAKDFGVTADIFEQVNGSRRIETYDAPAVTMVDNIFEYMLRAVSKGRAINFFQKAAFETLTAAWRPHRREQFDEIWRVSETMRRATEQMDQARGRYEQLVTQIAAERDRVHQSSIRFTDKKPA
jgi:glycosyltransferase involved in cell wall biosynthesis